MKIIINLAVIIAITCLPFVLLAASKSNTVYRSAYWKCWTIAGTYRPLVHLPSR